jgi:protein SCO1/2
VTISRRDVALALAGTICALGGTLLFGWWQVDGPGASRQPARSNNLPLHFYKMDFSLIDHSGRVVRPIDWIGRPTLVFFGFTYCPDVCPTTLSNITGWLEELGDEAVRLRAAFITVDPERDNVQSMADYVSYFHPSIIGYTGGPDQIAEAARMFRVKYEKVFTKDDYTMNHTASVFVYDKLGEFVSIIDYHEPQEYAVPKIRRALS